MSCNNESNQSVSEPELSNQEHNQLLLDTKQAILNLDIAKVDTLSTQIDINRLLPDNSSLLAWAVETQEPQLVELLLQKGAAVDVANSNRFTPIIQACRYGNSAIINALLDKGANPNSTIEDGTSAFQLCAGSASSIDLATMANLGANISAQNKHGQTPLMFAANFGNTENLKYLVNQGAKINQQTQQGYSPLFFAIKSYNLDTVKAAITLGADLHATAKDGTSAPQLALYTANYEYLNWFASELNSLMAPDAVKQTLTAFDRNGQQLLHAAVEANQPQLVSQLLALGADSTTISEPSKLKWRYEANFKTENYYPPQLTPLELAKKNKLPEIINILGG
ncbi:MAG: ankyrin repeat domain-containing protein [Paraglaciecola sp.]|uniref:ankyrin repeat domain-containing protein n=1 Tax=Paraglaciecola sp. TaxID=1920173 RepID=UPI003298B12C